MYLLLSYNLYHYYGCGNLGYFFSLKGHCLSPVSSQTRPGLFIICSLKQSCCLVIWWISRIITMMLCLCVSPYRYRFVTVVAVLSENIPFSLGLHMISFFISVFIFVILDSRYFYFCCFCFCSILFLPLGWKPQNPSVLKSGFLVVILFPQFTFLWDLHWNHESDYFWCSLSREWARTNFFHCCSGSIMRTVSLDICGPVNFHPKDKGDSF